jgi:hypothetical protein
MKQIPIRFRYLKIPVVWQVQPDGVLSGRLEKWKSPDDVHIEKLSAWALREEFFKLPENDTQRLAAFLNYVGVWSKDGEQPVLSYWSRSPLFVKPEEVWAFRLDLKDALIYRKQFTAYAKPVLPENLSDLIAHPPTNQFSFHFELAHIAEGVVTVTNARQMLIATVLADVARGLRFKVCKRHDCDCEPIFEVRTKHKRQFCSQYCGHLFSLRKKRLKEKRRRKTRA